MGLIETMLSVLAPPHPAGRPFIVGAAGIAVAGLFLHPAVVALGIAGALFCWFFFRDPPRVPPPVPGAIVSPADGRVVALTRVPPPPALGLPPEPVWRISIFLSVLNVHINRMPAAGRVLRVVYHPGRFLNAAMDKASEENERNEIALDCPGHGHVAVVQIAGLIARRILCSARAGDTVAAAERFGLIRFGSRTDLYLPPGHIPAVAVGQTAIGGETIMAIGGETAIARTDTAGAPA